ncbi:MAG: hypothetical protein CVV28_08120 [Methanobacteriales archaeon HGW-Methanobacteriales-1]|jgi:hypothetical protein|nr:MAG: hypothetical protein CVV28_08120 [Methanobacteriales archaeon HGW-Methanobacteriales-1]
MNLIELINSVTSSLSTREIAIIILLFVFLIIIFSIKSTRKAIFDLLRIILSAKKVIIPFIGMTLYISLILYLLYYIELFNISLVKNAIFWFIIGAIPLFYKTNDIEKKYKNFFRNNVIECFALPAIFSFLINFNTFNVIIELILISIIIFIVLLISVSKTNAKYKPAEKFFSIILVIIFLCLILNFIYNLFINPNGFLSKNTLITFILPAILTIFLLPYIYALALYIEYDSFYSRLKAVPNISKIYKYVFKKVFKKYNLDFFGLTAFLPEFRFYNIQNNADIKKEILKAEKRVNNKNSTDSTKTSHSTLNTFHSMYSPFENKFVSFSKRGDLKIEDKSTDTKLDLMFYDDDELVGQIISDSTTEKNIKGMIALSNESTTIAERKAVIYSDSLAIGAYIFIDDNYKGDKMIISIDFDPAFPTAYNIIENTLMIKQNPRE